MTQDKMNFSFDNRSRRDVGGWDVGGWREQKTWGEGDGGGEKQA